MRWMQARRRYREMKRRLAKLDRLDRRGDAPTRIATPWLGRRWPLRDKMIVVVSCLATVAVLVFIGVTNSGWADPAVDIYSGAAIGCCGYPDSAAGDRCAHRSARFLDDHGRWQACDLRSVPAAPLRGQPDGH